MTWAFVDRPVQRREPGAVLVGGGGQDRRVERVGRLEQAALAFGGQQRVQLGDQRSIHANES